MPTKQPITPPIKEITEDILSTTFTQTKQDVGNLGINLALMGLNLTSAATRLLRAAAATVDLGATKVSIVADNSYTSIEGALARAKNQPVEDIGTGE